MLKKLALALIPATALGAALMATSDSKAEALPLDLIKKTDSTSDLPAADAARGRRGSGFRRGGFRHGGFRHGHRGFRGYRGFRHHRGFRHFRGYRHYRYGYRHFRGGWGGGFGGGGFGGGGFGGGWGC